MLAAAAVAAPALCAPAGRAIVAEVDYDAIGDDTGHEFVELFNPTAAPVPLAGLRLEAGDGAGPGRWTLRWTGAAGDTIAARSRFVIGGALVVPLPQAIVALDLQNGPDAVRLVWPDGVNEVVGYGAQIYPEYACGTAAVDVAAGQSLARIPDDADFGSNALDFRAAPPSPGAANRPSRDVALVAGSLAFEPEQPPAGGAAILRGTLANRGDAIEAGAVHVSASSPLSSAGEFVVVHALAAGDSERFAMALGGLAPGKAWMVAALSLDGDEAPANDRDSLRVRIGAGPLEINEIQFHPTRGEGEWVELRSREAGVDPSRFTLSDRVHAGGTASGGEGALLPESLVVFAQNRAAFLAAYPGLDARRVWQIAPWSSLNNSDDSSGTADAVIAREADGTRSDRVDYSAAGVPNGVPIERAVDGHWGPTADPEGTPLAPPRPLIEVAGRLAVAPRRVRAGQEVRIGWSLPWSQPRAAIEIYDLAGHRAARPLPEDDVTPRGERRWIATLPPGVYVLSLRASGSGASLSESRALRIEGSAP